MREEPYILVINMTSFFNRPLYMYSFGDIRFGKPVALKKVAYILAMMIIWNVPLFLIAGFHLNVVWVALSILPPFFLGNWMSKPSFGGMSFLDFAKVAVRFLGEPKGWADLQATDDVEQTDYYVEHETWVSRRRELHYLADIEEAEHAQQLQQHEG